MIIYSLIYFLLTLYYSNYSSQVETLDAAFFNVKIIGYNTVLKCIQHFNKHSYNKQLFHFGFHFLHESISTSFQPVGLILLLSLPCSSIVGSLFICANNNAREMYFTIFTSKSIFSCTVIEMYCDTLRSPYPQSLPRNPI